jgi:putative aldouronate transport system permease protein
MAVIESNVLQQQPVKKKNGLSAFTHEISKNKALYAMFLPVAIWFIIFAYIPMFGIIVAFKDYNYTGGILFSPNVGFDNFKYLFKSGRLLNVVCNTIGYNIVFLAAYTVFSILAAVMISEMSVKWFKKISQSLMFLPYFISWVVINALMYNLFGDYGLVNHYLGILHIGSVDIYSHPSYWYLILPILYVWKWVGYGSVLYLSAIMGIDSECYEAAKIDGCNIFQRINYITLPLLKPTVVILILLGVGRLMRGEFDMIWNLVGNNSILINATENIDTLVFRSLMGSQDFGMSSSAGFFQSVLCFVIIIAVNAVVRKVDSDNALF